MALSHFDNKNLIYIEIGFCPRMIVNVIKDLFEHGQYQAILDRLAQPDIQTQVAVLSEPDQKSSVITTAGP